MIPDAGSWLGRVLRLPLRLVPPDRPRRVVSGANAGLQWIPGSAPHGCWIGNYESELQQLLVQQLREGDVMYDVGANVGFFTLLASRRVGASGKVVAFEPLPRNLGFLRRHIELNRIGNVSVVDAAVAEAPGEACFEAGPSPSQGHIGTSGMAVRLVTLDGLLESGTLPPPRIIKMDIEGAESRALSGARRLIAAHRPIILLSTHGYRQDEACCAFLAERGYSTVLRRDGARDGQYERIARPIGAE